MIDSGALQPPPNSRGIRLTPWQHFGNVQMVRYVLCVGFWDS